MREFRTSGSVRGALSNERPYREHCRNSVQFPLLSRRSSMVGATGDAMEDQGPGGQRSSIQRTKLRQII